METMELHHAGNEGNCSPKIEQHFFDRKSIISTVESNTTGNAFTPGSPDQIPS